MVVQHNLRAMNANRMLGITQGTLSKSAEKLSSGYKVNRAADDAAGLSISEKMRKHREARRQALPAGIFPCQLPLSGKHAGYFKRCFHDVPNR